MPTAAQECFDHIVGQADPFAYLNSLVKVPPDPPTFEEEWLDFKGHPKDKENTLQIWRKAISGYANTGGGVLVWGLDARKGLDGIDCVIGRRLITDPNKFK